MGKNKSGKNKQSKNNPGYNTRSQVSRKKANKTPIIVMTTVLVGLFIWIMTQLSGAGNPFPSKGSPIAAQEQNGVQVIAMQLSTAGYNPNNFTVKKGVPVRIDTDATSDAGCVRGIMIPDFNINKSVNVGRDSFTFTPDKTGTFTFTCQMKMSSGTINVI